VSTVTEVYPSDFAAAKKSIEGDANKFKAFSKQEEIEGGWHLEFELTSMMDQSPLFGVEVRKTIDGKQYSAPEISAQVLLKLKRAAENYLGEKVTDAKTAPEFQNGDVLKLDKTRAVRLAL